MARNRYDWGKITGLVKECIEHASSLGELHRAVNARMEPAIPYGTFSSGLPREMKARLNIEYSGFGDLQLTLLGPQISPLAQSILNYMRRGRRGAAISLISLCDLFDRAPTSVKAAIEEIQDSDYFIEVTDDRHVIMPEAPPPTCERLPVEVWTKPSRVYRWGVLSDTHLCNRNCRLDALEAAYDIYEVEGIGTVLHLGNMIDGEFRGNRSELLAHGVEGQLAYTTQNYPKRKGVATKFLSADCHEGWWARDTGLDIGRHMGNTFRDSGRGDLQWIGHVQRDLELHPDNPQAVLRLFHPGGGSAYALSYPVQKHVESWQGGEKPAMAFFGHYHKYDANYIREVFCLQAGAVCDQTLWMMLRKLAAHVGVCIVEVHLSEMGSVSRVKHEWIPFYNKGYYQEWDYAAMWKDSLPKVKYAGDGKLELVVE